MIIYVHCGFSQFCRRYVNIPPLDSGEDPGFKVRGVHLKKLRRVEGGANIFGVFRVKNHDFTPKNLIFSNVRGGARQVARPPGSASGILLNIFLLCSAIH